MKYDKNINLELIPIIHVALDLFDVQLEVATQIDT